MTSNESVKFSPPDHAQKILSNLNFLRQHSTLCDVQLRIGSRIFWAHKALLSASSYYFQAMFTSGLSETEKSDIELHGVNDQIFALLLDFIYTGQIEIKKLNVQDVLIAADMFQITEVIDTCYLFLKKQLDSSNCIGIYQFAENHNFLKLKTLSENFIHQNFSNVTKEDEFFDLPLPTVKQILSSEHLQIDQESQVFDAAITWIFHDLTNKRKFIYQILQDVRLPLVSKHYLKNYVTNCSDLSLKVALTKLLEDIPPISTTKPRAFGRRRIFIIGGYNREIGQRWSDSCTLNTSNVYQVPRNEWKTIQPMLVARSGHGAAVVNGMIYVIGGESDDSMIFSNGEVYDIVEDKWEFITSMIKPRTLLGVCALDGIIYALGGWIGSSLGDSIECYDPDTNKWSECGYMMSPRCAAGVIAYDGLIYVVGGLSDLLTEMDSFECYNPIMKVWSRLSCMRIKRAYGGVAVLNGYLYAIGGASSSQKVVNTVERYSFERQLWEDVCAMQIPRVSPCVATVDGRLYVMGGRTSSDEFSPATTLVEVECYDPEESKWSSVGTMPKSCCDAGVVIF